MYGDPLDYSPEIMALCFNCKYMDCVGAEGCRERRLIVLRLRHELGENVGGIEPGAVDLSREYTIAGVTMTGHAWVRERGMRRGTVLARLKNGYTLEEALEKKRIRTRTKRGYVYTVDGVRKTGAEWERALGLWQGYIARQVRESAGAKSGEDVIRELRRRSLNLDGDV